MPLIRFRCQLSDHGRVAVEESQQIWGRASLQVEPLVARFLDRKVNLRQHFSGIYATASDRLALCSRKGQELTITPDPKFVLQDRWD